MSALGISHSKTLFSSTRSVRIAIIQSTAYGRTGGRHKAPLESTGESIAMDQQWIAVEVRRGDRLAIAFRITTNEVFGRVTESGANYVCAL